MKAIGFFFAVFFSMLSVFLVATGEVRRWFSDGGKSPMEMAAIEDAESPPPGGKNLLDFDFYDVEEGLKIFSIRAHLSQDDFQVESKLDQIQKITLQDGTLEVPLPGPTEAGATESHPPQPPLRGGGEAVSHPPRPPLKGGGSEPRDPTPEGQAREQKPAAAERLGKVVLEFKSAVYERRDPAAGGGKRGFQVLLKDGRGTTIDGTQFFFEDLVFASAGRKEPTSEKEEAGFRLSSRSPVSIRNDSIHLRSPSGFEGTIKEAVIETFTFLPPVSAILDPEQASLLPIHAPATRAGAGAEGGAREQARGILAAAGHPAEDKAAPARNGPGRIAITCEGPLSLTFKDRDRSLTPPRHALTLIRFQDAVKLYLLDGPATLDSLPPPRGNRFECEHLQIELEEREGDLVPFRALATMAPPGAQTPEGVRVKIFIQEEPGAPLYTVDGDRLEWVVDGASASMEPGSIAILHGEPTLRGEGLDFAAKRAVFRVSEQKLLLEEVRGSIENADLLDGPLRGGAEKPDGSGKKRKKERRPQSAKAPAFGPVPDEVGGPFDGVKTAAGGSDSRKSSLPPHWDMKADEAEFLFEGPEANAGTEPTVTRAGGASDLSRFVARSRRPDGIEIRSRAVKDAPGAGDPIAVTGNLLTYIEAEKKATLEGTEAVKPRFTQGKNWMEARKIHVHIEEGLALFEEEVKARIEDAAGRQGPPAKDPAPEPALVDGVDVKASNLAVRFVDRRRIRDLRALGAPGLPVEVTVRSRAIGQEPPRERGKESPKGWCRFIGPELYWDQETQAAQLAPGGEDPARKGASRVEFEGGELVADRIRFDRKTWKADLSDDVTIRLRSGRGDAPPGAADMEVKTGRTQVEFFPELAELGAEPAGPLRPLSRIQRLRSVKAPGGLLEVRSSSFVARAEECDWDAARREVRFHGNGLQEIEISREDFQGPVRAREIVFNTEKRLITLEGGVLGRIVQASAPEAAADPVPSARIDPASHVERGSKPLVWVFETSVLEVEVRERVLPTKDLAPGESGPANSPLPPPLRGGGETFELVAVRARDKVHLRNEELALQLLGDDLVYDEATRKIHIFSPAGRPQTLLCDRGRLEAKRGETAGDSSEPAAEPSTPLLAPEGRAERSPSERIDKIVSQEIWVLLHANPQAVPERGEPRQWLLVNFQKDVIGSFHLPEAESASSPPVPPEGAIGDVWKMVSDRLTLYIDPSQPRDPSLKGSARRLIPWAIASGNVDFSSGNLRATAERAIYEDPLSRLTLIGAPARVLRENKRVFEDPEITIRKVGDEIEFEYRGEERARTKEATPRVPAQFPAGPAPPPSPGSK